MEKIKVSIITVTHNVSSTIRQTINSVLNQSYDNIEYILVDGMSDDGTWEIIQEYSSFLAYGIHEPDKGLYDAMNKGLCRCTGSIIGIINGDDWYEPDAVKEVVECFQQDKLDIVYGDMWIHDNLGNVKRSCDRPSEDIWYSMVSHPTIFVRKECYERFGVFNLKYAVAADYDLILRFYAKGCRFYHLDVVLCNFRLGGLSERRAFECEREVNQISLSYIEQCPNKEKYLDLIEKRYKPICNAGLALAYKKEKEKIQAFLKEKFGSRDKVVIFGTGTWGDKCFALLERMDYQINGWVDNDSAKWNMSLKGFEVFSPEKLFEGEWNVILAINDYKHDVSNQLKKINLSNVNLRWVDMLEFALL